MGQILDSLGSEGNLDDLLCMQDNLLQERCGDDAVTGILISMKWAKVSTVRRSMQAQ